jgi:hypothetical protein
MNIAPRIRTGMTVVLAGAALMLGGCASTWRVDNRVESHARWSESDHPQNVPPQAPQTYRFERLPSESEGEPAQRQTVIESLARDELVRLGWTLAEGAAPAPWKVQVSASGQRVARAGLDDPWPYAHPYPYGWPYVWPYFNLGVGGHGGRVTGHLGVSGPLFWGPVFPHPYPERPYVLRKVSVVVRDAATGRVVYETQAAHDGVWNDSPQLWRSMFSAALSDFPTPPSTVRRVDIDLPR